MSQAEKVNKASKKDERKKAWQTLLWVLREVHTLKRSYTPLVLINTLLNIATIYVPILLIAPVLEGFISKNWQKAWTWGLTLVGLSIALNLLKDFLSRYLKIQGSDLHEAFSAKIHEKPMTLDYPSSQDNDAKNAFQRAFQSMNYEGYFNEFIGQLFTLLGDLLSLITSVSLSAVLLLSSPKTEGWLSVIAQPWLATTVTVGLVILLSLLTKKSNDQLAIQRKRYHDEHITVETDLNYIVMQVLLSHGNYALYQVYNMIPMIAAWYKEKSKALTDFLLKANIIIKREILFQPFRSPFLNYTQVNVMSIYGKDRKAMLKFQKDALLNRMENLKDLKEKISDERLMLVDFDNLVCDYDKCKTSVENFIGLRSTSHKYAKDYFNPENARQRSISIYKDYLSEEELQDFDELERAYFYLKTCSDSNKME